MKDVPGDDDQIRLLLQQIVPRPAKHFRDIRLTLIRAPGRLTIELPEAEVQVREVRELHFASTRRMESCVPVAISIAAIPSAGAEIFMVINPFIAPPTTAPRESENSLSPASWPASLSVARCPAKVSWMGP